MPSISRIRFTNVVYESGNKRYNDELFIFDGHNGAVLLENGGGKTVFIQTLLQAIIPHTEVGERKAKETLYLQEGSAHIAIEWLLNEKPRRYVLTSVTLFPTKTGMDSLRYVYEYGEHDPYSIDQLPFVKGNRPSDKGEMSDYYTYMANQYPIKAKFFPTSIRSFREYLETEYQIIATEWESIVTINSAEGDVEAFFEKCKTTNELIDRLLIPTVELAMSGYQANHFADMFENHREQFKKYKQLKEKIEENKRLQGELAHYVAQFAQMHQREEAYGEIKQRAQAYRQLLQQQALELAEKLKEVEAAFRLWINTERELKCKEASWEIACQQEEWQKLENLNQERKNELAHLQKEEEKAKQAYYSLRYAKYRDIVLTEEANLLTYQQELEKLAEETTGQDIQDELAEVAAHLHYVFLKKKERFLEEQQGLQMEQNHLQQSIEKIKQELGQVEADREQTKIKKAEALTTVKQLGERREEIEQQIIHHRHDSVEQLLPVWLREETELAQQEVESKQRLKELAELSKDLAQQQEQLREQSLQVYAELSERLQEKKQQEQEHEQVLQTLGNLLPSWQYVSSVYERQASMQQQIQERLHTLGGQKEKALLTERLTRRFVDDYGEQTSFFADPYIAKQLASWTQFSYLETGINYLQTIQVEVDVATIDYPLWATTLITTEQEKAGLVEKLETVQQHLTYPIYVLTLTEATSIVKGKVRADEVIQPAIWQQNQDQKVFNEWQIRLQAEASQAMTHRKELEETIDVWRQAQHTLQAFLQAYPWEKQQTLLQKISNLEQQKQEIEMTQKAVHSQKQQGETERDNLHVRLENLKEKLSHLDRQIQLAHQYIQLGRKLKEAEQEARLQQEEVGKYAARAEWLQRQLDGLQDEFEQKKEEINSYNLRINYEVDQHELFLKVCTTSPSPSNSTQEALVEKWGNLELTLRQIQITRGEWLAKQEASKQRKAEAEQHIQEIKQESLELLLDILFPSDGEKQLVRLYGHKNKLAELVKEKTDSWHEAHTQAKVQLNKLEDLQKKYKQDYPEHALVHFQEPLLTVLAYLQEERQQLQEKKSYLDQQGNKLKQEEIEITDLQQKIERYELVHQLTEKSLQPILLSEEESQEFAYRRKRVIEENITQLNQSKEAVEREREQLHKAQDHFRQFCRVNVQEPRMQRTALEGVEQRKTYQEILQHQQLLENTILQVIQISEATILSHDEELQQFITYVHTHLRKLREELLEIPKKTRVKVKEEWKEIYQIQVPDWDDQEAKLKIREYLDWILEQINQERYQDAQGVEQAAEVRKLIEKSLQSVPLLRELMGNETIRVKCRKVENDNHISSAYHTWEQSNRWSGGEKWSKNMTLFLGLLNYIAEKKQHIHSKATRHRTVILDNPFGKASSDHVLSPVFFIAEQLGFQIIALTAHAEGKFLRDYFPIIYSCRLRHAQDSSKQIVTKEKLIHHAYFRDHAPETLERIGEQEQLSLLFE